MNGQFDNAVKQSKLTVQSAKEEVNHDADAMQVDGHASAKEEYDEIDIFMATPIKTSNPRERGADPVSGMLTIF